MSEERFAIAAAKQGDCATERRPPLFDCQVRCVRFGAKAGEVDGGREPSVISPSIGLNHRWRIAPAISAAPPFTVA